MDAICSLFKDVFFFFTGKKELHLQPCQNLKLGVENGGLCEHFCIKKGSDATPNLKPLIPILHIGGSSHAGMRLITIHFKFEMTDWIWAK